MSKKKLILLSVILFVFLTFAVYKFSFSSESVINPDQNIAPPEILQPVQASQPDKQGEKEKPKNRGYEIKEYNGSIAVFEIGENKPFRVTDIEVKNLPETDRKELKKGIKAPDEERLHALLEDYLS